MRIENPVDGMAANDPVIDVLCPCGNPVRLRYNGGELDWDKCKCGVQYYLESTGVILRIK